MQARKNTLNNRKGGTFIEYALIAAFSVSVVSVMATYISRGIESEKNNIDAIGTNY